MGFGPRARRVRVWSLKYELADRRSTASGNESTEGKADIKKEQLNVTQTSHGDLMQTILLALSHKHHCTSNGIVLLDSRRLTAASATGPTVCSDQSLPVISTDNQLLDKDTVVRVQINDTFCCIL